MLDAPPGSRLDLGGGRSRGGKLLATLVIAAIFALLLGALIGAMLNLFGKAGRGGAPGGNNAGVKLEGNPEKGTEPGQPTDPSTE